MQMYVYIYKCMFGMMFKVFLKYDPSGKIILNSTHKFDFFIKTKVI